MENQQSIKTVLSFGAKSVEPGILENLLIGRDKNAEYLFKSIEGIVNNGNNQQILIIGQRGMGKTHLIRVLYHRCQHFIQNKQLLVAYFSEEEYGVANFFDFLIRILYSFIRWHESDKNLLQAKLEELQNTNASEQVSFIETIIKDYISDKPLLILAENFGDILNAIGPQEQGKLRAWMYENKRVNIIASSQTISDDFDKEDRPFYGFFNLYYLKSLSFKESLSFLISLAELDQRKDVIKHLKYKGIGQVRAIHELVKGNHRLLVTFYEFLKSDTLAKLSNHFIKTINDLKPYYETYIRYLPPQQQKIVRYIALSRKPQQGTAIVKNCFIDQKSLSKQLSELVRKNLLEAISDQTDKRNKLYDINEPLLRISIEVGEHKEGITALFVDFLALYYDENELILKKIKFADLLKKCDNPLEKKHFQYEIQAIEKALIQKKASSHSYIPDKKILKILIDLYNADDSNKRYALIEKQKQHLSKEDYIYVLLYLYIMDNEHQKAIDLFSQLNTNYINERQLNTVWGYHMLCLARKENNKELYSDAIKKFEKAQENNEYGELLNSHWGTALCALATINDDDKLYNEGLSKLNRAIEVNKKNDDNYINLAHEQISLSIKNNDDILAKKAFKNIINALKLKKSNRLFLLWGGSISFSDGKLKNDPLKIEDFKNNFCQLSIQERIVLWKDFGRLSHFYFFKEMYRLLKLDLKINKEQLRSVLIDWIINILARNLKTLKKEHTTYLKEVSKEWNDIPELKIIQIYIDVYEEYVINKNKNAIYELTKEQRLFFQKNILREEIKDN